MLADQDLRTFHDAGIHNPDDILAAAAAFLRQLKPVRPSPNALADAETGFLSRGGARGLGEANENAKAATNLAQIAGEFAQMVATALGQQQVANYLKVTTGRVRQRSDVLSLYAIDGANGRVYPGFQFENGTTLPGLEAVLAAINPEANPVAVQRFFLTPSPDLESDIVGTALSPRDWLLAGHNAEAVITLAREL